jgi:hypothetical protein
MHATFQAYAVVACGLVLLPLASRAHAQIPVPGEARNTTCSAILSDATTGVRLTDSSSAVARDRDTTTRSQLDSASFGFGGERGGAPDIILRVGIHADEVRFAKQPNVRVRLCWGGDTLRVVQRENLPSPIVAGTTYRNVYVAVELVGRLNAECLAGVLGVGNSSQTGSARPSNSVSSPAAANSANTCTFLGGSANSGGQTTRPPVP